jgi:glycerol-3-phosphate dehydrogenase (NAD(P)+)
LKPEGPANQTRGPAIARIAVVGTTAWGTTLAALSARSGNEVLLLARSPVEAETLDRDRENRRRRPGLRLPDAVHVSADVAALRGQAMIVLAVPAASLAWNFEQVLPHIDGEASLLSATKGIEPESGHRMSEVIAAAGLDAARILVISGPNFSAEIAAGLPAATVIAGRDPGRASEAQAMLMSPAFRVYTSDDVAGVELGGALKNIVAIACGISDGLGSGQNAKAALMTRALAEMTRLGLACGARPFTFLGLAGMGDLIATCESDLSRNRRLGLALAAGKSLEEALAGIEGVVEGIGTTKAARLLARARSVDMPIAEELYAVLFEGKSPLASLQDLMQRAPKQEFGSNDSGWERISG